MSENNGSKKNEYTKDTISNTNHSDEEFIKESATKIESDIEKIIEQEKKESYKILSKNIQKEILNSLKKYTDEKIDEKIRIQKENIDKLENKIENSKLKIIETLGIFVALFTFISVDFQVFKTYQDPQAIAGLTLVLLGALLGFIVVLDFVLSTPLSFTKIKKIPGSLRMPFELMKSIKGYEEKIDFSWLRSSTWGPAITIKFLPLILLCFTLITSGLFLFIFSSK